MTIESNNEKFSFYKNKSVLVCGGNGFIGSHLTNLLLESEADVTILSRKNKEQYDFFGDKLKHIQVDLLDLHDCRNKINGFDFVFNTSGVTGGIEYNIKNSNKLFFENSLMNLNLLLALCDSDIKKYQFVSSVAVYSNQAKNPLTESALLNSEDGFGYSHSKILGEEQCKKFAEEFGMKISIIRADNTFGPRDDFSSSSRVVPALIKKILKADKTVEVWGSGNQIRTFVFVKDLVRGLLLGLEKYPCAEPINLSSDEKISIKALVDLIIKLTNKNYLEIQFDIKKPEGNLERCLDISKARTLLGFIPKWTLKQGMHDTINWVKEQKL